MQLQFVGRNIEVTEALKTFTTDKMQALEKRFARITLVNIVFHIEHNTQIAEATVHMNGFEIHAHAHDQDMYAAIDKLLDKLLGQITKHKEKLIDSHQ